MADIHQQVLARDLARWRSLQTPKILEKRGETATIPGCVASVVDPFTSGPCWGRLTLDHVKDVARMGKRAPTDADHMVSLCQGHTEDGMQAGRQWNTAHRAVLRWYLATCP